MESLLISAAGRGDVSTIRKLLRKQINVNAKDESGFSAISRASAGGHFEAANLLIQAGADVNALDGAQNRPIHHASAGGHSELAKLILQTDKLQWNAPNKDGFTPIDLAHYDSEIREILDDAVKEIFIEPDERVEVSKGPGVNAGGVNKKKRVAKKGKKGSKKGGAKKGKAGKKKGKKKKK